MSVVDASRSQFLILGFDSYKGVKFGRPRGCSLAENWPYNRHIIATLIRRKVI